MTTHTGTINSAIVSSSRVYLSSHVSMLLLVKVMAPEETFVVVSKVIIFVVQILESVRTRYTSYSYLTGRISLATSS